jgi:drug/metabolite transporter (DMT)-like permease
LLSLLFSVAASVSLFIIFRYFSKFGVNTFQAVAVNYCVCVGTGLAFADSNDLAQFNPTNWWGMAIFLGFTFIGTFYLMGITTQKAGVTVATLANKMSMVIPVLINLLVFKSTQNFDFFNGLGLLCALAAVVMSSYTSKKDSENETQNSIENTQIATKPNPLAAFILPVSIFFLGGVIDTSLSYANLKLLQKGEETVFPIVLFATAACIGLVGIAYNWLVKKEPFTQKSLFAGIILGVPNYFSIYFLLQALSDFGGNGAFVIPILNIGTILLATFISVLLLGDKLNRINIMGVLLALVAIVLLSYQKIAW